MKDCCGRELGALKECCAGAVGQGGGGEPR